MRWLIPYLAVCFFAAAQQDRERAPALEAIVTTNIVVSAGEPVTVPGPSAVAQFAASLSIPGGETNGVISDWSFSDAPGVVSFSNVNGLTNTGYFTSAGRYTITYRARKGIFENSSSFYVFVTSQGITNFIPTISITSPPNGAEFTAPINLTLTADAQDKDGTIDRVVWYNGPVILGTSTVAPYSLTLTNAGATNYVFAAAVTDNRGATNLSIARSVLVNPAPPTPPVNVPPFVTIDAPLNAATFVNPVILSFEASAIDTDGTIQSVTLADNGVIVATLVDPPYIAQFAPTVGTHILTAIATDDLGAMTIDTNTITVTAQPAPNPAPVVTLVSPADGATFVAPATVTVSASATDNGSIVSVQFFSNGGSIGTDTTAPYSISFPGVGVGAYVISATATDNLGAIGVSTNRTFTVTPAPGIPPTVTLTGPANGATILAGSTIVLSATAGDADGTVTNVSWYYVTPDSPPDPDFTNQVIRTFINNDTTSPYTRNWTPLANSYGVIAIATDNAGLSTTTAVSTITVRLPIPPSIILTLPTNGQVFAAGVTIPMAATIVDPDTLTTSVAFWQYQPDNLISTDTISPYTGSWVGVPAGNYSLVAKVTSSAGVASSSAVSITIQAAPPVTVYVDAGPTKTAQLSVYKPYFDTERTANQLAFNSLFTSSGGQPKYDGQYILNAYRDMYVATRETNYIGQALLWCEAAVASATIIDSNGQKNWSGPWASPYSATPIGYELWESQGCSGMSAVFRVILTDPDLRAVFGTRAQTVYNFVRDHIVQKILITRNGLPWYRDFLHNPASNTTDKPALMLGMLLDLKLSSTALGNTDNATKGYPALVTEFARGVKDYGGVSPCFTTFCYNNDPTKCGLIWQKGHKWNSIYLVLDCMHANRVPDVVIDCYRVGETFDFTTVQGLADLFTKVIWTGDTLNPQFRNFTDGSNGPFVAGSSTRPAYNNGLIYSGWAMLSEFDSQALIASQATLRAIKNGVSNPSLSYNNSYLGRSSLAGHIAKAVSARITTPYAQLDGVVTGSPITSYSWSRISGPGIATILKPTSPQTTVIFNTAAVGVHQFRLSVVSTSGNVSDDVSVTLAAAPSF